MELNDRIIWELAMPGSQMPEYDDELKVVKKALELNEQGLKARYHVSGDEQSGYGKVLDGGTLYYEDPKMPGKHVEVDIVEGYVYPPKVKEGSLDHRVAIEKYYINTPPRMDNSSDAARYLTELRKTQPLEEKYLGQVKALLQKGYRFM